MTRGFEDILPADFVLDFRCIIKRVTPLKYPLSLRVRTRLRFLVYNILLVLRKT